MALFGTIGEFFESKENWSQYAERFEQFLAANGIEDNIHISCYYRTLANLCAPRKSAEEEYATHVNLL